MKRIAHKMCMFIGKVYFLRNIINSFILQNVIIYLFADFMRINRMKKFSAETMNTMDSNAETLKNSKYLSWDLDLSGKD